MSLETNEKAHIKEKINAYRIFFYENQREGENLEGLEEDGRKILKGLVNRMKVFGLYAYQ